MDLGIKGRRAIVTGGSSGIGFETARQFLEEGARVLITGRNQQKLDKARDDLAKRTGGEVHAIVADMTKEADIAKMVETAKQKLGGVDILVNNAGTMYSGRFAALDDNEMKTQLETKLFGFMRAIRAVYPMMKAQKWGRIVNTIGGAGKEPDPYMFGSGMTNSALLNLTKSLSTEFGEDNVLVNAICPGWVATDLWVRNTRGHEEGIRGDDRGGSSQGGGKKELTWQHGQAGRARKCHGFPVLRARKLHHRRVAQSRRRAAERPLVTSSTQLAQQLCDLPLFVGGQRREGRCGYLGGDKHGGFGHLPSPVSERDCATAPILWIVQCRDETTQVQAVNNTFDRRGVEINQAPKMILRTRANFVKLRKRGELSLGQALDHARGKDRCMALHGDTHEEAALLVEHIASLLRRIGLGDDDFQFLRP